MFTAGHWGQALDEYVPDYNLLVHARSAVRVAAPADNRVTVVSEVTDQHGTPVARMDYTRGDEDRTHRARRTDSAQILEAGGTQDVLAVDR